MSALLYIIGRVGELHFTTEAPTKIDGTSDGKPWARWRWREGACSFTAERGRLKEFRSLSQGRERFYARELPHDDALIATIAELERELEAARALVKQKHAERQAALEAAAQRGERVRVDVHAPADRVSAPTTSAMGGKTKRYLAALNGLMNDALKNGAK